MPEQAERPMESKTSHTHTQKEKTWFSYFYQKNSIDKAPVRHLHAISFRCFFFAPSFDSFFCVFILELDDETGEMKFVIGLELRVLSQRIRTKTG